MNRIAFVFVLALPAAAFGQVVGEVDAGRYLGRVVLPPEASLCSARDFPGPRRVARSWWPRARSLQELPQSVLRLSLADFALPYHERTPPVCVEGGEILLVALLVACDLRGPVVAIRLWNPIAALAGVAVPEAPMNEDHLAAGAEHQVGLPWKSLPVKTVPIPRAMYQTAYHHLRSGVLGLDRAHGSAALLGRHGYARRIAVGSDSFWTAPSRLMRVLRTVSGPRCSTSKLT